MFIETSFFTFKYFQNVYTRVYMFQKVTASKHFLAAELLLSVLTVQYISDI
jgi:hypothetical protein